MATLDDILTTQKNGVIAVNNLSQALNLFYDYYKFTSGTDTSETVLAPATLVSGAGRLISYTTVISGGASTGLIYDDVSYSIVSINGSGTSATITYNGTNAFSVGDTIYVYGVSPSGYNTSGSTVIGVTQNTVTYSNSTTGSITVSGIAMNIKASNQISSISGTVGTYPLGLKFYNGVTVIPASGQSVNVSYSLS